MYHQEGFTALWTGLGPNVARNAIINAAELASYDQVKQVLCAPFVFFSLLNCSMAPSFNCPYKLFLFLAQTILKLPGFKDDAVTHLLSGLGAGFFAVCIGSPVDVVRCPLLPYATVFRKLTLGCHWMSEFRYYFYFPLLLHVGGSHFLGILIFGHGRWSCFQKFPTLLCPEILPTIEN
jgi:hypothetical protein